MPRPRKRPWTTAHLALLGTMPDTHIAKRVHRTVAQVRTERVRRGISTYAGQPATSWPALPERDARLWAVYRAVIGKPITEVAMTLGWLAAHGWAPDPAEIIDRTTVPRSTAYRHVALLREFGHRSNNR